MDVIAALVGDIPAEAEEGARKFELKAGRKPPMREVRYHCRHCDSTVISLK